MSGSPASRPCAATIRGSASTRTARSRRVSTRLACFTGSLNVGGRGGYGNPGPGNAWMTGALTVDGSVSVGGELWLRAARSNIVGFDGGGRLGYHWLRTDGDDGELWFAYAQAWPGRPDIPRRVEVAVPLWAPVVKQTSDARLKSDVRPLNDVLGKLGDMRGVSYTRLQPDGEAAAPGSARLESSRRRLRRRSRSSSRAAMANTTRPSTTRV